MLLTFHHCDGTLHVDILKEGLGSWLQVLLWVPVLWTCDKAEQNPGGKGCVAEVAQLVAARMLGWGRDISSKT